MKIVRMLAFAVIVCAGVLTHGTAWYAAPQCEEQGSYYGYCYGYFSHDEMWCQNEGWDVCDGFCQGRVQATSC